jgi:hypothetical protein
MEKAFVIGVFLAGILGIVYHDYITINADYAQEKCARAGGILERTGTSFKLSTCIKGDKVLYHDWKDVAERFKKEGIPSATGTTIID